MSPNHCFNETGLYRALHHCVKARMLLPFACIALAATPALGQVFKWEDEGGVMHYSSSPPEKSTTKYKRLQGEALEVARAKTPKRAPDPSPQQLAVQELNGKVDALEKQVDAERQARAAAEAQTRATQAAYAQAMADQQAARNVAYIPTIPTVSSIFIVPPPHKISNGTHGGMHADDCRSTMTGAMAGCWQPGHWPQPRQNLTH